jgi:hypothetical protein
MTLPGLLGTVLFVGFLSLYFAVSGGDMNAWRAWGPWSGLLDAGAFASMVALILWDGKRRDRR